MGSFNHQILFVHADQLSLGHQLVAEEAFKAELVARLNSKAAKQAAPFSAFTPSLERTFLGLEVLSPTMRWQRHCSLALELLCACMAEARFCIGRAEEHQGTAHELCECTKPISNGLKV